MKDELVIKNGRALRRGFTTGSCAAAAATAAAEILLSGFQVPSVHITLPNGDTAWFEIHLISRKKETAVCTVVKDAGDDPDITNGAEISAEVFLTEQGFCLCGGTGVGIVTARGLPVPEGEPAINPVPRKMIRENIDAICRKYHYTGGVRVVISVKNGEELARKTFNPRLGIQGGISILGTTGIVEPMSEQALVDTIQIMVDRAKRKNPNQIIISPGNYGRDYCLHHFGIDLEDCIKCSNYIGETLDYLVYREFSELFLVGHIGKLLKLAGGIMNTHSSVADCRMEILSAHCALAGGSKDIVRAVMQSKTTDEALEQLRIAHLEEETCSTILEKILEHIKRRTGESMNIAVAVFTTGERLLMKTSNIGDFIMRYRGGKE